MSKDRITPLLFDEMSEEDKAYWRKKEPWNYLPPVDESTPEAKQDKDQNASNK